MFDDRLDAARQLAGRLDHLSGRRPLVLAIPRGGVPMGRVIADALGGELDVVLVHKLGAPGNPEFAIGAVGEDGSVQLAESARRRFGDAYIDAEVQAQQAMLRERRRRYTPLRAPVDPAGRVVVVVDDGSATGATMAAALMAVRARGPAHLVAALGCAPPDAVRRLEELADEVVCPLVEPQFFAVGQFFHHFDQVGDQEVEDILAGQGDAG